MYSAFYSPSKSPWNFSHYFCQQKKTVNWKIFKFAWQNQLRFLKKEQSFSNYSFFGKYIEHIVFHFALISVKFDISMCINAFLNLIRLMYNKTPSVFIFQFRGYDETDSNWFLTATFLFSNDYINLQEKNKEICLFY